MEDLMGSTRQWKLLLVRSPLNSAREEKQNDARNMQMIGDENVIETNRKTDRFDNEDRIENDRT